MGSLCLRPSAKVTDFLLAALVAGAFGVNIGARTFGINLDVCLVVGSAADGTDITSYGVDLDFINCS